MVDPELPYLQPHHLELMGRGVGVVVLKPSFGRVPFFSGLSRRCDVSLVASVWLFCLLCYGLASFRDYATRGRSTVEIVLHNATLSSADIVRLNAIPHVKRVDRATEISAIDADGTPILAIGKDLRYPWVSPSLSVIAGRYPKRGREVLTSGQWASNHTKRIGDTVSYRGTDYRIVGIADFSAYHAATESKVIPYLVLVLSNDRATSLLNILRQDSKDLFVVSYVHLFVRESSRIHVKQEVDALLSNRTTFVWAWRPVSDYGDDLETGVYFTAGVAGVPVILLMRRAKATNELSAARAGASLLISTLMLLVSGFVINLLVGREIFLLPHRL